MALQELSPLPPVTGYASMGNALAQAGATIGNDLRQKAALDRQRALQLQDISMAQAEGDRRYDRARADQLADIEAARGREDEQYARRRGDQLADVQDNRMYAEAFAYAENARKLKERAPFETNLQGLVNTAAEQLSQVRARVAVVSQVVMSQPPAVGPNDPNVLALAQQLAGGSRKKEDIAAMVPKALEQMQAEAIIKHTTSVRAANEVLQTLRSTEAQLTDVIQAGIQKNVAPNTPPPAAFQGEMPPLQTSMSQPKAATAADIQAALGKLLGGDSAQAKAAPSPASAMLDNPTNDPTIAAGNQEIQKRAQLILQNSLNDEMEGVKNIDRQIAAARAGTLPSLSSSFQWPMGGIRTSISNEDKALAVSRLLQEKAAKESRIKAMREQLIGPAASVTPPAVNTPTSSAPVQSAPANWWQAGMAPAGM